MDFVRSHFLQNPYFNNHSLFVTRHWLYYLTKYQMILGQKFGLLAMKMVGISIKTCRLLKPILEYWLISDISIAITPLMCWICLLKLNYIPISHSYSYSHSHSPFPFPHFHSPFPIPILHSHSSYLFRQLHHQYAEFAFWSLIAFPIPHFPIPISYFPIPFPIEA